MRLRHPSGEVVHLAYCTNVHGGETVDEIVGQLDRFAVPVREQLDTDLLGVGLWLSAPVARELAGDLRGAERLRGELTRRGLETVTLNGFPFRGFQEPVVKLKVYRPDWTETARLEYTLDLVDVLGVLLPDDAARGSISTLPLAWREPWDAERARAAGDQLAELADALHERRERTGREIRVGLEPEPGCVVETTDEAVAASEGWDRSVLGVCLDLCHLAVQFEDAAGATAALGEAGLSVVKSQVSAALHVATPHDEQTRAALESFDEERFLHQVRAGTGTLPLPSRDDLGEALGTTREGAGPLDATDDAPWRVHFHVPLGHDPEPPLTSTTTELRESLGVLVGGERPLTDHLEVETYTWSVVPEHSRPRDAGELATGIAGELAWVRDELVALGLHQQ
ncbi:metabolite traffic protein EboE [Terracoccus luteus]|uniref:Sugar phosphate isomerase/epimerase n=1 Tax=Terracoccus luteus TaxID=53356 RepID=A0A839PQX7_9MICO|nr:metabolite traffic protein EboE [Terracoccus luteus]MBB2986590.1 sugar phosphate isomerase/epimerase [Terracoccus luteus]MCP2171821.1 sugar phosphate isomerase/epimerase [Terracoccus luteus]